LRSILKVNTTNNAAKISAQVSAIFNVSPKGRRRANRLDDNAPGLNKILDLVLRKKVSTLIIETPDRLARFLAWDLIERVLIYHGVEIHIIQPKANRQEFVDEIKEELVDIIASAKELGI